MKNFSNDVDVVLVKATFKKMAEITRNDVSTAKYRMAQAIRVSAGKRESLEYDKDGADIHDVRKAGVDLNNFTKWAASVFVGCSSSQFIEGIQEMINADGADLRRQQVCLDSDDEEEELEAMREIPTCGPLVGLDLDAMCENLQLEEALQEMVIQSPYSIWRSMKGRKVIIEMMDTANEQLFWMASILESRRRQQTANASSLVDPQAWPPPDSAAWRVAKDVLPEVFDDANVHYCAAVMRKRMVMHFIPLVNEEKFTTQILRDQMQALVLATSEVVVNRLTEECYPSLVNVYEDAMRSRR